MVTLVSVIFQDENGDLSLCRKNYLPKDDSQFRLDNTLIITVCY